MDPGRPPGFRDDLDPALPAGRIVDLGTLAPELLGPLQAEEASLHWDLLRWQAAAGGAAPRGVAWLRDRQVLGYLGLSMEGGLAVAGPLFSSRKHRAEAVESALLRAAIQGVAALPEATRFTGEFLLPAPQTQAWLQRHWPGQVTRRWLMEAPCGTARSVGSPGIQIRFEAWRPDLLPSAALLLVEAGGAADGWRLGLPDPVQEARSWLETFASLSSGCRFEAGASFVAWDEAREGTLAGLVIACRMGADIGHIAQLSVSPGARRKGLGSALLARSLEALGDLGCLAAHLVVDEDHAGARSLYWGMGFEDRHRFPRLRLEPSDIQ
jgi:ribosomal protein S18 acetylase RimI-like enzyme